MAESGVSWLECINHIPVLGDSNRIDSDHIQERPWQVE